MWKCFGSPISADFTVRGSNDKGLEMAGGGHRSINTTAITTPEPHKPTRFLALTPTYQMVGVLIYVTRIKNMKIKSRTIAAISLGAILIGGITAASISANQATTLPIPPSPPQQNPNWLMEPSASLEYSLYQAMALIDNADPFVGEMGIYQQLILQRAIEFSATASQAIRDSEHQCFQKSLNCPYDLIERGMKADWEKATSAESKAAIIFKYRALLQARHGALLPPKESSALFPRIIERLQQDRELAERLTLNGIAGSNQDEK